MLARFEAPFTALPQIEGEARVGATLKVTPNLSGVKDVVHIWHRSGYPIPGHRTQSYTVTQADIGSSIRCLVRAVGARDQPEAWTQETGIVSA
jgi:hypothetical protein